MHSHTVYKSFELSPISSSTVSEKAACPSEATPSPAVTSCSAPPPLTAASHNIYSSLLSDALTQHNTLLLMQLEAAQIQIQSLRFDLEIEQVRRRNAETMCRDLRDSLDEVTAERDQYEFQSEALVAARAALARPIDSSCEDEQLEECTDSVELGPELVSVTAERDALMSGIQELLSARALLANDLLAADSSLLIEEHSSDSVPLVHMDSEVYDLPPAECAVDSDEMKITVEKRTRFVDLVDVILIEEQEVAPPPYDEFQAELNDMKDSIFSSSCSYDSLSYLPSYDSNMSLCSIASFPSSCSMTDIMDMSLCSTV